MPDALKLQMLGLVENCNTVINAKKGDGYPEPSTVELAGVLLAEAKKRVPNDAVLQSVSLGETVAWTTILTAMTAAVKAISNP